MKTTVVVLVVTLVAGTAVAQPVVDGTRDGDQAAYGDPLFVQTITTAFGNNVNPDQEISEEGSELDAVYATVAGGYLYVLLTGNLETGSIPPAETSPFNKFNVHIDSIAGGLNTIEQDDQDPLPPLDLFDNALQNQRGLTFDTGFDSDYFLAFVNGFEEAPGLEARQWVFSAHYAELKPVSQGPVATMVGGNPNPAVGIVIDAASADPVSNPIEQFFIDRGADNSQVGMMAAIDNSNIDGVAGSLAGDTSDLADPVAAAAVLTGIEFAIPLASIGGPTGDIKLVAVVNNADYNYLSNQITGGLPVGQGNLGSDGAGGATGDLAGINLADINGTQYVTVSHSAQLGDVNFDGAVNGLDVDPFVSAVLSGKTQAVADVNQDGAVNGLDVEPFVVAVLQGGVPAVGVEGVPEPSAAALLIGAGLVGLAAYGRRRRRCRTVT